MRISPHGLLPRQYNFLTRHSAKSFVTYYTYDHGAAMFTNRILTVPHGLGYAPLHDMWVAKQLSTTGNAVTDFPTNIQGIKHGNVIDHGGYLVGVYDSYTLTADKTNVYIRINHITATSGTYHVYFHVKLYVDDFNGILFDGTRTSTTLP